MSVYFTSDTHFGHGNILKYCNRPFMTDDEKKQAKLDPKFRVSRETIEIMDNTMIDNINAVVKSNDTLYHLGDFCFSDYNAARRYRDRINCKNIILIWGNHDHHSIRSLFSNCFDQTMVEVDGKRMWLNHYPQLSWDGSFRGAWMLHGHVHGNIRKNPAVRAVYDTMLICDVGVDGPCMIERSGVYDHLFKPWSVAELTSFMEPKQAGFKANPTV